MLALVLGLIISAGLYFAYLWPSVEPESDDGDDDDDDEPIAGVRPVAAAHSEDAASPAP